MSGFSDTYFSLCECVNNVYFLLVVCKLLVDICQGCKCKI